MEKLEFLNNPLLSKNIKFNYYVKSYTNFIYDNKDEQNEALKDNPSIYIIDIGHLSFNEFFQILNQDLKLIYKVGNNDSKDEYNWHYEKTNNIIFLNINNIEKHNEEQYKKIKLFVDDFNIKGESYHNKFIIIDKTNFKIYNLNNIYIIHKKEFLRLLKSDLFKPFIDYLDSLSINNKDRTIEEHLEIQHNILFELFRLFVLEIVKEQNQQDFKNNVVEEFKSWLLKTDINHKSLKSKSIMMFDNLIIVNDYKQRVKKYNRLMSNITIYQTNETVKQDNQQIIKNQKLVLKID